MAKEARPGAEEECRTPRRTGRLGVIGCGGFSRFALEAVAALPEAEVVALADPVESHARSVSLAWQTARHAALAAGGAAGGIQPPAVYADYRALLARPDVDVVWVITPPHLHHRIGRDALLAGKHLFLEKPGSITPDEAAELEELAARRGLCASVDFVMRHNPIYRFLRSAVAAGAFGPLERLALENNARDDHMPPSHWFWDEAQSGGIWVEHGVHFFDLAEWLAGPPAAITALAVERHGGPGARPIRDAVAALALHPHAAPGAPPAVASYYHGFVRPGELERTTLTLAFQRAQITVSGWIATRLEGEAVLDEGGAALLAPGGAGGVRAGGDGGGTPPWLRVSVIESYPGGRNLTGRGRIFTAVRRVRLEGDLGDRWEVYRASVRAGLRDLLRWAADPRQRPAVDLGCARAALRAAAAATASQRAGTVSRL